MRPESAADAYRRARVENAPPLKLVHLMYEGALRFLDEAQALDPARDAGRFGDRLQRAESVVSELRLALDPAHAPELAGKLAALYVFAEGELRRARLELDAAPLDGVRDVLGALLAAWKEIDARAASEPRAENA